MVVAAAQAPLLERVAQVVAALAVTAQLLVLLAQQILAAVAAVADQDTLEEQEDLV